MNKNKCSSCGAAPHECSCKNKDFTKAVIEIDNPGCITLMHKVTIPASMGDDTAVPPAIGKYKNVLLYYEANSKSYLYSSDGIPTLLANGLTDYEQAVNLPEINGHTLLGNKTGEDLGLQNTLSVTPDTGIQIENDEISGLPATENTIGMVKSGDGLEVATDGTMSISDIEQYAHFFDTVADMKAATNLVAGDYARTLGFHTINDGGNALYKIRTITNDDSVDEMIIIEMADNTLVAELVLGDTVCPEMLGAYGDGTHDDTTAIAKTVTLNTKIIMSKNYLISSNIRIGDIDNLDIDAEKSTITYNGDTDGYAFLIQHINGGNIKFGMIESNGGCIKLYSTLGTADRVQYLKLKFNHLKASADSNCIYGKVENTGWLTEVQLDGGYCSRGGYGIYLTNLRTDEGGIGGWKFNNIGFEGTTKNIHLDASSDCYQRGHYFENIRYVEHVTSPLFETSGRIQRLTMVSWGGLEESRLLFETSKLTDVKLVCPIYENGTNNVIAHGIYYKGNKKRYIYDDSLYSLPTKNTTNVSSGTIRFIREGNMCVIRINDLVTLTASGNLIDSLPYAPQESITNFIGDANGGKMGKVYVNNSGELKFSIPSADIGTSYAGEIVYVTGSNLTP